MNPGTRATVEIRKTATGWHRHRNRSGNIPASLFARIKSRSGQLRFVHQSGKCSVTEWFQLIPALRVLCVQVCRG